LTVHVIVNCGYWDNLDFRKQKICCNFKCKELNDTDEALLLTNKKPRPGRGEMVKEKDND
jgi:hypothetical protein